MALLVRYWRQAFVLALVAFTTFSLVRENRMRGRSAGLVVDADQARALCRKENYPVEDYWERVRAMGVVGALFRPETLGPYLADGMILRFTAAEISKLRAAKAADADAPLKPRSLWIRSGVLLKRIRIAAGAEGLKLSYRKYKGMHVLELPEGRDPARFPAGFDPARVRLAVSKGLTPVYLAATTLELSLSLKGAAPAAHLIARGFDYAEDRDIALLREELDKGRAWLVFAEGDEGSLGRLPRTVRFGFLERMGAQLARVAVAGETRAANGPSAFLREILGGGRPIILAHLDLGRGVEGTLSDLRVVTRRLRRGGYTLEFPRGLFELRLAEAWEIVFRIFLGFLLTLCGPILALRAAVGVLRWMQEGGRLPQASPIREAASSACAAALTTIAAGLVAYALLSQPSWRLGASVSWELWASALTFVLSFLALYAPDPSDWKIIFRKPVAESSGVWVALPVAATVLLLFPPDWLAAWGPRAWLNLLAGESLTAWWLADRWREWLVGWPCLFVGL